MKFSLPQIAAISLGLVLAQATLADNTPPQGNGKTGSEAAGNNSFAAVVNGHTITRQRLGDDCLVRYGKDVLESMVSKHLLLQACAQQNIVVTNQDVDDEVNRIATKFGIPKERYLGMLHQERNIRPEDYQRDIIWPMLCLHRLVANQIAPTQEELDQAFEAKYGPAVKCRMIMAKERTKINDLYQQVTKDPGQFGRLALEQSEDPVSASVRGLIPDVRRFPGDTVFEQTAFTLSDNQICQPFSIADQWIILQCVRRMPAAQPDPKQLPVVKQVLSDEIKDRKTKDAATALFAKLQQQAQVVNVLNDPELRKQYPGTAALVNGTQILIADVTNECVKRHGHLVLDGEIHRKILEDALQQRRLTVSQADIDQEIGEAAKQFGYLKQDGTPDLATWLKASLEENGQKLSPELYIHDAVWPSVALKKLTSDKVTLTPQEMQQGFESNYGRRAEVLAIVLSDQRTAQKVWQMARDNPTEEFFGQLAAQYSIEPVSRNNFGKVPPLRKHGGQPLLEQEAFNLKEGALSGIVASGNQYVILKSQGLTKPVVSKIEDVREELARDLSEKKRSIAMAEEFERLLAAANITNFLTGKVNAGVQQAAGIDGGANRQAGLEMKRK